MLFLKCIVYLALIGLVSFIGGRFIPQGMFNTDKPPVKPFAFEKNGKIYDKIKIKAWQSKMIDMSKIFPKMLPEKKMENVNSIGQIEVMIHETCVAEFVHVFLAVAAIPCIFIWRGIGGIVVYVLYAIGNLPYIVIQRYNRPRLIKIHAKFCSRKEEVAE